MKKTLKFGKYIAVVFGLSILGTSCEKMIETPPPNEILVEDAIKNTQDLQMLLNGSYNEVANSFGGFYQTMAELMSDNLALPNNNDYREIYNHNVLFFNTTSGAFYSQLYRAIFRANFVQEHMNDAKDLTEEDSKRISGEVAFIRALCHFTAVRMYAQPWGYTSDNSHDGIAVVRSVVTTPQKRESVATAYAAIEDDLNTAIANLPESNNGYATKWAAKALMAQVAFQKGDYSVAAKESNDVISSGLFTLSDTINVFTTSSASEHIYSVISYGVNDQRSGSYTSNFAAGVPACQMDKALYASLENKTTDKRLMLLNVVNKGAQNEFIRTNMFNQPYFDVPVLHLKQMLLIRAESNAILGTDYAQAVSDINTIINKAYTTPVVLDGNATPAEILARIRSERRVELMFQGDRIHEVKRLGAIEKERMFIRGHEWNCKGMLMQFPITEKTDIFNINPTGGCD
jgi:starch-binding outer membrane protein, SusD/RagB family